MIWAVLIGVAVLLVLVFALCAKARRWLRSIVQDMVTRVLCGTTCEYCQFHASCDMDCREG